MFDLGQYANSILISYAVGLIGVATIVMLSVRQQRKIRARIRVIDDKRKQNEQRR